MDQSPKINVGDGVLDVPAEICGIFSMAFGELLPCAMRGVEDAAPYSYNCNFSI